MTWIIQAGVVLGNLCEQLYLQEVKDKRALVGFVHPP